MPGEGRDTDERPDAVEQVRRWLVERGLAIPDDEAAGPEHSPQPRSSHADTAGTGARDRVSASRRAPADAREDGTDRGLPDPGPLGPPRPAGVLDGGHASWPAGVPDPDRAQTSAPGRPGSGSDGEPDADPQSVARLIVLRKLAAQSRTRSELSKALRAKDVPDDAAEAVLDRMEEVGLVDDAGFARDWVESRQLRRHLSRTALRRELMTKGVDRAEIDVALEQVDGDDELAAAQSLVAKKARSMAGLDRQVRHRRLAGMLGRRGFSPGVISEVLIDTRDLNE